MSDKENLDNQQPDDEAGLYVISVAAELSGLHPQTLRQYDRLGLVSPNRTVGRNRRYSLQRLCIKFFTHFLISSCFGVFL